jgi:hypothetical protein
LQILKQALKQSLRTEKPFMSVASAAQPKLASCIQERFEELKQLGEKLDTLSGLLDDQVAKVEIAIDQFHLEVMAEVMFESSNSEDGITNEWTFGYARLSGKWQLVIKLTTRDSEDEKCQIWAFSKSPRDKRLLALGMLPILLGTLVVQSEETSKFIMHRVEFAKVIATNLRKNDPTMDWNLPAVAKAG